MADSFDIFEPDAVMALSSLSKCWNIEDTEMRFGSAGVGGGRRTDSAGALTAHILVRTFDG